MDRNLAQIEAQYQSLVPHGCTFRQNAPNKKRKIDYILAVSDWYVKYYQQQGHDLPGQRWVHEHLESPMLAQRQTYLKPADFDKLMEADTTVADIKLDGCRVVVTYFPGYGIEIYGRGRSVNDLCFQNYTDKIDGLARHQTKDLWKSAWVLDGELTSVNPSINGRIVTSTCLEAVASLLGLETADSWEAQKQGGYPLRFNAFDILMADNQDLMEKPLRDRLYLLQTVLGIVRSGFEDQRRDWFPSVERVIGGRADKQALFDKVRENKLGDGIILKPLDSVYRAEEARGGKEGAWVKMKISMSQSLGEDIDMFVTGFEPGTEGKANENLVGSIKFSVYLMPSGEVHELAVCSGISDELRREVTVQGPDGKPQLNQAWLGRVAVVDGMDMSSKSRKFMHARIVRWREDKQDFDCKIEEALLNNMVL